MFLDRDGISSNLGPVDGHDFKQLEETLRQARNSTRRVPLIHVVTHKGHGYEPAEDDPVKFHQPSSPLGEGTEAPTYSKVFRPGPSSRLMRDDESVVGISAAMLEGTGLVDVRRDFPDRVFDVGIAEQQRRKHGGGNGVERAQPFRLDLLHLPPAGVRSGSPRHLHSESAGYADRRSRRHRPARDGKTHHGAFDISYLRCLPNAVVAAPMGRETSCKHLVLHRV